VPPRSNLLREKWGWPITFRLYRFLILIRNVKRASVSLAAGCPTGKFPSAPIVVRSTSFVTTSFAREHDSTLHLLNGFGQGKAVPPEDGLPFRSRWITIPGQIVGEDAYYTYQLSSEPSNGGPIAICVVAIKGPIPLFVVLGGFYRIDVGT
jgi:hypothetical protein